MKNEKLSEKITESLRQEIMKKNLPDGMRIIQNDWAKRYETSRMPVRIAIENLEREGLVEISLNKGATVIGISMEEIRLLFYVRYFLEGCLAENALPLMTEEDHREIELLYNVIIRTEDRHICEEAKRKFHEKMYARSKWKNAIAIVKQIANSVITTYIPLDFTGNIYKEYEEMYEAIRKKEPTQLRKKVEEHIRMSEIRFLRYIEQLNE